MKKAISILMILSIFLTLCGCGSVNSKVKAWDRAIAAIKRTHDSYESTSDKYFGYPSGYREPAEKAQEAHQNNFIRQTKRLARKNVVPDEEFLEAYLQTHTFQELFDGYYSFLHNEGIRYGGWDALPDKVETWLEQITLWLWDSMQRYYDIKPTTLPNLITADAGTYYSEHPDAQPQEETKQISKETSIDGNGKSHYETRENTVTVEYYGDYAVAHNVTWDFGGGKLGWQNGTFYDIPDRWEKNESDSYYYRGRCVKTISNGNKEELTLPVLLIDGDLYRLTDMFDGSHCIYVTGD